MEDAPLPDEHTQKSTVNTPPKLHVSRLKFTGPDVDVILLEAEHLSALWTATMDGELNAPNLRLFDQIYGRHCDSLDSFRNIICHGSVIESHIPLTIRQRATGETLNFIVLQPPTIPEKPLTMLCTRFLEPRIQAELQLEGLYLILCHIANELRYDVTRVRQAKMCNRFIALHNQRSLQGSIRRSLLVKEEGDEDTELFVMTREQWPALEAACEAWLKIPKKEGGKEEVGGLSRFPGL